MRTSSSVPEIAKLQLRSLGTLRQSIILRGELGIGPPGTLPHQRAARPAAHPGAPPREVTAADEYWTRTRSAQGGRRAAGLLRGLDPTEWPSAVRTPRFGLVLDPARR